MGSQVINLTILAVAASALSALATLLLLRVSPRLRLQAQPRADRWHKHATPNTGGLAILFTCAVMYVVALRGLHTAVVMAAGAMSLVGLLDDRIRLRALPKLMMQCALALAVVASGTVFHASPWHAVNVAFSFLWIVGITNSFNLIDNMDGLAAGVTVIISVFRVFALAAGGFWPDAALAAVVGGAFAGFLLFNHQPARIFMGDCGSMLAGFALAATTIASPLPHTKAFAAAVFYPVLTFIYPIFDTLLVSWLRRAAGKPVSVGGRDHSSHRLAYLGMGERQAVWLLWGLTALGSAVGLMARWMPLEVIAAAALLMGSLAMFGIFLSTLPPYRISSESLLAGSAALKHLQSVRAGIITTVDCMLAGLSLFIAFLIRYESNLPPEQLRNLLISLPAIMICHGVVSCVNRNFDPSWQWFNFEDALRYGRTIVLGAALGWFTAWLIGARYYPRSVMLLYCVLCFCLTVAVRASLPTLHNLRVQSFAGRARVAIFGAIAEGEMIATLLSKHERLNSVPVLFLDNDLSHQGIKIHGIPVRHSGSNLRRLAAEFRLQSIVVSAPLDEDRHAELSRSCVEAGLQLWLLDIGMRELAAVQTRQIS